MAIDRKNNLLLGRTVGTFELQSLLGRGGMGAVYLAQQSRPHRSVAVKTLLPAMFQDASIQDAFLARFRREADAIAALDHINIMPIYEYGEQEDVAYLVMPYVTGGTLRQALEKRRILPLNETMSIIEQIAAGLDYAHARGIIHRDLKPANILFHADGRVVLADFGLAKLLNETAEASNEATATLTGIGGVIGTPEYFSPEQATGNAVDRRTDVYSLGVVLYHMLGGRVPFTGSTPVAVAVKHTVELPPSLSQLNPTISPAIEAVVMKALAKKPEQRYASAGELARALRAAIDEAAPPTHLLLNQKMANIAHFAQMSSLNNDTIAEMPPADAQEATTAITPQTPLYATPHSFYANGNAAPAPIISASIHERPEKRRGYLSAWMTILGVTLAIILVVGGLATFILAHQGSPTTASTRPQATHTAAAEATAAATEPNAGSAPRLPAALIPAGALIYGTTQPACDSNSQLWSSSSTARVSCTALGTELVNTNARYLAGVYLNTLPNTSSFPNDYVIQAQAQEYSSSSGAYGIFFRNQPGLTNQGTYSFMLYPQQNRWEASIYDAQSGTRSLLYGSQTTLAVQGLVTIDIIVSGDTFQFYVNGQKQGGAVSPIYPTGTVGLAAGPETNVYFTNLAIYHLPG